MLNDHKNTILAVILSGIVLIGWQYFFVAPQMQKQQAAQRAEQMAQQLQQQAPGTPAPQGGATSPSQLPGQAPRTAVPEVSREAEIGRAHV